MEDNFPRILKVRVINKNTMAVSLGSRTIILNGHHRYDANDGQPHRPGCRVMSSSCSAIEFLDFLVSPLLWSLFWMLMFLVVVVRFDFPTLFIHYYDSFTSWRGEKRRGCETRGSRRQWSYEVCCGVVGHKMLRLFLVIYMINNSRLIDDGGGFYLGWVSDEKALISTFSFIHSWHLLQFSNSSSICFSMI